MSTKSQDRREFRLNRHQADYLARRAGLATEVRDALQPGRTATLSLTLVQRDELLELLSTRLQVAGFDTDWDATAEGEMIESIIDVLTVQRSGS